MMLPGWETVAPDEPDPLTVARADVRRLQAAWDAAQAAHRAGRDDDGWTAIVALQPRLRAALVLVDRLESGPKFWH